ncbi:hypothetical protein KCP74_02575 [Salmonella enterica subsp. enterica]|nr:hypothetical protein KCP74_02575 [Salmonella enterica subsp. enterica]
MLSRVFFRCFRPFSRREGAVRPEVNFFLPTTTFTGVLLSPFFAFSRAADVTRHAAGDQAVNFPSIIHRRFDAYRPGRPAICLPAGFANQTSVLPDRSDSNCYPVRKRVPPIDKQFIKTRQRSRNRRRWQSRL